MLKKIVYAITTVILLVLGKFMLQGDYIPFLQWWASVAYIGIIFLPMAALIFSKFNDKGYLFSKTIGIAVIGYFMWLLSSVHILKFTEASCILCVAICLILNGIILFVVRKKKSVEDMSGSASFKESTLDHIIIEELIFFALFLLFTYVRGFKPEAYGTEKFMDYGFMTSMMRSEYMPPQDFWFSGSKLNYYYVGQYMASFLTKLSFVKVSVGYNLALMMVGAFGFMLPYSLVYNIAKQFLVVKEKNNRIIPVISALLAGTGVCIAGNMHYPTFKWFEPLVRKFFGMEASTDSYWFPDATRFIGYHPETKDKTIHEFPCYSFVLGDLHAHVINIMFVVTVLGILFAWMCTRKNLKNQNIPIYKEILNPAVIMISFFIGLFHTTNYWDFPIYFVACGAVILFTNLIVYNFNGKALGVTALQGIFVICFSELVCLPFTLNFNQISTTPLFTVARTPLNQLIILWGLPIFTVVAFLCFMIANYRRKRKLEIASEIKAENEAVIKAEHGEKEPVLFHFMKMITVSDLFIITIGLCAIGLIIMPEIIYIEDIYNGDYKRANTMFKLTYQAFIMFGICFGYIFVRLLAFGETKRQKKFAIIGLLLFSLTVCYAQNAVNSWYGNIFKVKDYEGLDCTAFLNTTAAFEDDVAAIDWLNDHVTGTPVILEANGDSYTDYERVSVMTGLPTILGWRTHEWLWKSDTKNLDVRTADIETIYTSTDETKVRNLLKQYNLTYIYVGKLEQDKFPTLNHELLKSLGDVVYISPVTDEKPYETYIVQIQK
ncbi:MAG: DUF2298 domain-containing protein [Herbinix sp.]|nr:DUF2298 domain-containing protein [Herbinix sp.]